MKPIAFVPWAELLAECAEGVSEVLRNGSVEFEVRAEGILVTLERREPAVPSRVLPPLSSGEKRGRLERAGYSSRLSRS